MQARNPLSSRCLCINGGGGFVKRGKNHYWIVVVSSYLYNLEKKVERRMKRMWGVGLKRLKKNCHDGNLPPVATFTIWEDCINTFGADTMLGGQGANVIHLRVKGELVRDLLALCIREGHRGLERQVQWKWL
jgi:hypothetical protein